MRLIGLLKQIEHPLTLGQKCSKWRSQLTLAMKRVAKLLRISNAASLVAFASTVVTQCLHVDPAIRFLLVWLDPLLCILSSSA